MSVLGHQLKLVEIIKSLVITLYYLMWQTQYHATSYFYFHTSLYKRTPSQNSNFLRERERTILCCMGIEFWEHNWRFPWEPFPVQSCFLKTQCCPWYIIYGRLLGWTLAFPQTMCTFPGPSYFHFLIFLRPLSTLFYPLATICGTSSSNKFTVIFPGHL